MAEPAVEALHCILQGVLALRYDLIILAMNPSLPACPLNKKCVSLRMGKNALCNCAGYTLWTEQGSTCSTSLSWRQG